MQTNFVKIFLDLGKEILYFPFWWYSRGVERYCIWAFRRMRRLANILAFGIMLKNIYRPLYGDYSVVGILIGPLIRIFWCALIFLLLLLSLFFFLFLFFVYLDLPICAFYLIVNA